MALRVHYSEMMLPEIRNVGDITLNASTVKGVVEGSGTFSAYRATTLGSVDVTGKAFIELSKCRDVDTQGTITTLFSTISSLNGHSIFALDCRIGQLRACAGIIAIACPQLGSISSISGTVALLNVKQVAHITGRDIFLNQTRVIANVVARRNVAVFGSKIDGTLECSPNRTVVIQNSTIDTIVFKLKTFKKFDVNTKILSTSFPVLRLINSKVKNIIFHGHSGKVMLINGSMISGNVMIRK